MKMGSFLILIYPNSHFTTGESIGVAGSPHAWFLPKNYHKASTHRKMLGGFDENCPKCRLFCILKVNN